MLQDQRRGGKAGNGPLCLDLPSEVHVGPVLSCDANKKAAYVFLHGKPQVPLGVFCSAGPDIGVATENQFFWS